MVETMMKKKVLIMPSYWPSSQDPAVGAQVQEQTILIADHFDVKVLFCVGGMGLMRYFVNSLLSLVTGSFLFKSCINKFSNGGIEMHGYFFCDNQILPYSWRRNNELKAVFSIYAKLESDGWKPDLIHARTAEYAGYCGAKLSQSKRIPLLLTENVIFVLRDIPSLIKVNEYIFALETAQKVAVVSTWLKTQLLINNINCKPVVIGNWVNESKFHLQRDINNEFTILTIGHTGFTKDWTTFFKSIKYLVDECGCVDFKVLIIVTQTYDRESRAYIPDKIAEYELQNWIDVRYQISREEIAQVFQRANVFVSTSLNETFGIATAESMFSGVPVVATDNGGINDFIADLNGIKVNIGDYKAVADAILKIKSKSVEFKPEIIRDSVLKKFGTDVFKNKLVQLYYDTIKTSEM